MSMLIGIASKIAVKKESCLGEKFLVENMLLSYEVKAVNKEVLQSPPLGGFRGLQFKLIPHTFYRCDTVYSQFLPDFTDVYIYGSVTYNDIISPYLV